MTVPVLVCPADAPYLPELRGRSCVLVAASVDGAARSAVEAVRLGLDLHAVLVRGAEPLAELRLDVPWGTTPLALVAPRMGPFEEVVPHLPWLRLAGVRVHLPAHLPENLTALRVLASLGVDVAADLDGGTPDWDALADLAAYALLGLVPRGSIEPFESLARDHRPAVRTALVLSAFDDPARFVHADGSGRLALSARELAEGRLVAGELSALDGLEALPAYREPLEAWRSVFLTLNACSTCPGWRLCGGVLGGRDAAEPACRAFASELLELVEQRAAMPRGGRAT